jgi:thiamine pyrophosphokinase
MQLPSSLSHYLEWVLVGPMGPQIPDHFLSYPILGVDGGGEHTPKLDVWLGDGDSSPQIKTCPHILKFDPKKSSSDLALALSLFADAQPYKLHLWGFLGGRKDHELFNLGECLHYLDDHLEAEIIFYNNEGKILFHLLGAGQWKFTHHGLFSIGSIKKVSLRVTGECEYPIIKNILLSPLSSLGLSNKAHGEIMLYNDGPVFVYFPEGK